MQWEFFKKHKKKFIIAGSIAGGVFLVTLLIVLSVISGKQSARIKLLEEQNLTLSEAVDSMQAQINDFTGKVEYPEDTYNYLAIGNSITVHSITSYWWNECGMAASCPEKDFVHLVVKYLEKEEGDVFYHTVSFKPWEISVNDRAETYSLINPCLDEKLDLITIQLGENVEVDDETFATDLEELIGHIQAKAPNAKIIVLDDFWDSGEKIDAKKEVCESMNVEFASLEEIKGNQDFEVGHSAKLYTVYDKDGKSHVVEHLGVKNHPNDKGMKYIAEQIIACLEEE